MRRERTPRDDDEDEPDVSLRERMTRLDGELVEAREVLERVAPGEPRVQAPATVAEAFALADAAQAAKAKEEVVAPRTMRPVPWYVKVSQTVPYAGLEEMCDRRHGGSWN